MKPTIVAILLCLLSSCGPSQHELSKNETTWKAWCIAYKVNGLTYEAWCALYEAHLLPNQDNQDAKQAAESASAAATAAAIYSGAAMGMAAGRK